MTPKFNIGDRVVASNPDAIPVVEEFAGSHGTVVAWIAGHEPELYRVAMDGMVAHVHFYEYELNQVEERDA